MANSKLEGLHPDLVKVVIEAINQGKASFLVTEGLRTKERQEKLVASGASKTMNSRHLTGHAVDLAAVVDGAISWDWPLYHKLAEAIRDAANAVGVEITWGGVWDKPLNEIKNPEKEMTLYSERMRKLGKRPFADGPHFELSRRRYS